PGPVMLTAYNHAPQVDLNWSPSVTPGTISRYEIFRATCATCWLTFIGDAGAAASWYTDAAMTAPAAYYYRIVPRDAAGVEGPATTVAVRTPGLKVTALVATPPVLGVDQLLTVAMTVSNSGAVPVFNVAPAG